MLIAIGITIGVLVLLAVLPLVADHRPPSHFGLLPWAMRPRHCGRQAT